MVITSIEKGSKNKERYSVYIDHNFAFTLSEEDYLRFGFYEKKEISEEEINVIKKDVNLRAAKSIAVRFLALKLRTEKEVRNKLSGQGYEEETIELAVADLRESQFINDLQYARKFIMDRLKLKPSSRRFLQYELEQKGISRADIAEALEEIEVNESAIAEALVKKKFGRQDISDPKVVKKVHSFLMQRGFDYGIITDILSKITDMDRSL